MENPIALAAAAVEACLFEGFVDFDDHFEDVANDPRNPGVNQALAALAE